MFKISKKKKKGLKIQTIVMVIICIDNYILERFLFIGLKMNHCFWHRTFQFFFLLYSILENLPNYIGEK